ncbi:XRE family transcriptional regulator [Gordonia terrae]|uniref:XRE family transcriptional regulator n=1 Tax=Gordonia terrae TaxID=2055 RepID=UPI00200AF64C|nr:XRE family transcriptional regulator [Gordonia terrae]UPW09366.1 XRE family transcriptional regulator [Gordonia terrae]
MLRMLETDGTGLSKEVIEALKLRGHNQSQIAEMFGVTRQAVSWHLKTYGGTRSTRQVLNDHWPWETSSEHCGAIPYRRLRDHAECVVTGGREMSMDKLKRLQAWWRKMQDEDLVVEFDPGLEPVQRVSTSGGFAYRQRASVDGELLIRVNGFTRLTDEGKTLWARPDAGETK